MSKELMDYDSVEITGLDDALDESDDKEDLEDEKVEDEVKAEVDPKIVALEAQIQQLTSLVSQQRTAPAESGEEKKEVALDVEELSKGLLKSYHDVLDEIEEDRRLTPQQAAALSAQVGDKLLPIMFKKLDEMYGNRIKGLTEDYTKLKVEFTESQRLQAVEKFLANNPEVEKDSTILTKLNNDLTASPDWQGLLANPNASKMYAFLNRVYAPYKLEADKKARIVHKREDDRERLVSRKTSDQIRKIGADTAGDSEVRSYPTERGSKVRATLISELRKELRKNA